MPWFIYTPLTIPGNPTDPNHYTLTGMTPPSCPDPNNFLCAIQTINNFGQPILTAALICEINAAIENRTESVNVLLKPAH